MCCPEFFFLMNCSLTQILWGIELIVVRFNDYFELYKFLSLNTAKHHFVVDKQTLICPEIYKYSALCTNCQSVVAINLIYWYCSWRRSRSSWKSYTKILKRNVHIEGYYLSMQVVIMLLYVKLMILHAGLARNSNILNKKIMVSLFNDEKTFNIWISLTQV